MIFSVILPMTTEPTCGAGKGILEYPAGGLKLRGATKKGGFGTFLSMFLDSRAER
jgi:hypothetical protein